MDKDLQALMQAWTDTMIPLMAPVAVIAVFLAVIPLTMRLLIALFDAVIKLTQDVRKKKKEEYTAHYDNLLQEQIVTPDHVGESLIAYYEEPAYQDHWRSERESN